MHLARQDLYPLDERIERAFAESDFLVVEIDLNSLDALEASQTIFQRALYAQGRDLKNALSPQTYRLAEEKFKEFGIDLATLSRYKPWFLAMNLETIVFKRLGFDPQYGIDIYFLNKARGTKEILQLETLDAQLDIFDGFSEELQDLFFCATLADMDTVELEMDRILDSWRRGDAAGVGSIVGQFVVDDPRTMPIYEELFTKRNRRMVSGIEQYLKTPGTYFVIVGAGHLVGEDGIIALLELRGYSFVQQ